MDLLTNASNGMINIKITIDAPIRLPIYTSGSFLIIELIPIESSPIEVNKPSTKNESRNEDVFSCCEIFSTDLIARPDPIQTPKKDNR